MSEQRYRMSITIRLGKISLNNLKNYKSNDRLLANKVELVYRIAGNFQKVLFSKNSKMVKHFRKFLFKISIASQLYTQPSRCAVQMGNVPLQLGIAIVLWRCFINKDSSSMQTSLPAAIYIRSSSPWWLNWQNNQLAMA